RTSESPRRPSHAALDRKPLRPRPRRDHSDALVDGATAIARRASGDMLARAAGPRCLAARVSGMACVRERRATSVTTHRRRVAFLGIAVLALMPLATPALGSSACGSRVKGLAQLPGGQPLADPIPHIPINGTAGFVVPGANTLAGGDLSIGLGYLGQQSVCQQEEGIFDQNTLFLALGYAITDRIQLSFQAPYTWYEADKSDFNGSGVDDLSFGVGYRFLDEAGWRPALSVVGYAVAPTAERKEGLGTNEGGLGAAPAPTRARGGR